MKKYLLLFSAVLVLVTVFVSAPFSRAETTTLSACVAGANISPDNKLALQAALEACNKEIAAQDQMLKEKQKERVSYERDVVILGTQITKTQLSIKASDLTLLKLKDDITTKVLTINELTDKINHEKDSIAQLLRKTDAIEQAPLVEVMLSQEKLSDFFLDVDSFGSIKNALKDSINSIDTAKVEKEKEKGVLEEKKNSEADAKAELEAQKRAVQKSEKEKAALVKITKNKEKEYAKILADKKALSARISAALFELRDTNGIQFGQAYEYAKIVEQKTGVRPAFLLAIFSQESSFGKNVGACYLKDAATGDGVGMNTGKLFPKTMKPGRDVEPFMQITSELGRDPYKTRISCPQSSGWGGAMGPAQFIPSTWMGVRDSVASYLGVTSSDPWKPLDAFMAAGIFLRDLGAAKGGYTAERNSACRYFGGTCASSASYGNSVMSKATSIQENQIDKL
jgi:membrane-bound lytic murein transglycosylase B